MPEKSLPPEQAATLIAAGWAVVWAFVGRLLYVLNLVRLGQRDGFFTLQTAWELGVAIGMGIVAGGLSEYFSLTGLTSAGFIAAASYLGPQVIELALSWVSSRVGVPTTPQPPEETEGKTSE